jgi:hypothetical protein
LEFLPLMHGSTGRERRDGANQASGHVKPVVWGTFDSGNVAVPVVQC